MTLKEKNTKKFRGRKSGQAMAGPAGPPTTENIAELNKFPCDKYAAVLRTHFTLGKR